MSLLQDALRRAQQGSGGSGAKTPLPGPGPLPSRRRERRRLIRAAVAALFLLAVVVLYLHRGGTGKGMGEDSAPGAPAEALRAVPADSPGPPATAASAPARPSAGTSPFRTAQGIPAAARKATPGRATPPPPEAAMKQAAPQAPVPEPLRPAAVPESTPPATAPDLPQAPPDPRARHLERYNEGVRAQERGEWERSARIFREVVDADPSIVEAWNGLGFALMRRGDLPGAEEAIGRARTLSPNYPAAVLNEGLLRLREGRAAEAAALFDRAARLDPANPVPRVNLAIAQGLSDDLSAAERTLTEARERFPRNPDILYTLGALYERAGDRERSAEAYAAFLSVAGSADSGRSADVRKRLRAWGVVP